MAIPLLGSVTPPRRLIADKAYDADSLRRWLKTRRMKAAILSAAVRTVPYPLDRSVYLRRSCRPEREPGKARPEWPRNSGIGLLASHRRLADCLALFRASAAQPYPDRQPPFGMMASFGSHYQSPGNFFRFRSGWEYSRIFSHVLTGRKERVSSFKSCLRPMGHFPMSIEETLVFVGDSHAKTMAAACRRGYFGNVKYKMVSVVGATAVGLRHPLSKTQSLQKFRLHLFPYNPNYIPVFQMGEVDCGFLSWYRAEKYNDPILKQIDESLSAYIAFLRECRDAGYGNLIVASAVLPTYRDGQVDGEVARLRLAVKATQRQRTDLTIVYNERLKNLCKSESIDFVDSTPVFLDMSSMLIKDRFRKKDTGDHHLVVKEAGKVWGRHIMNHIYYRKAFSMAANNLESIWNSPIRNHLHENV